jgi:hypothetical protein
MAAGAGARVSFDDHVWWRAGLVPVMARGSGPGRAA